MNYENYTMQRIISEALERSNVGCKQSIKEGEEGEEEVKGTKRGDEEEDVLNSKRVKI
jgi:hypothetical protein